MASLCRLFGAVMLLAATAAFGTNQSAMAAAKATVSWISFTAERVADVIAKARQRKQAYAQGPLVQPLSEAVLAQLWLPRAGK